MKKLLVIGSLVLCFSVTAATKYVRTTGNDTTGDGSTGNPWKTIQKGVNTISAGDTLLIGDGTYGDDALLDVNKAWASETTLESESGIAANVVIVGASGAYNTLCEGTNVRFRNVTFITKAPTDASGAVYLYKNGPYSFIGCIFTMTTDGSHNGVAVYSNPSGTVGNVTLSGCTINQTGAGSARGIQMNGTAVNKTGVFVVTNCTINVGGAGIYMVGATNLCVVNSTITTTGQGGIWASDTVAIPYRWIGVTNTSITAGIDAIYFRDPATFYITNAACASSSQHGVIFGRDGNYSATTAGLISGTNVFSTITCTGGHGLLIGADCTNTVCANVVARGSDYGTVVKECDSSTINNSRIYSGTSAALYFKAGTNSTAIDNVLYGTNTANSACFTLQAGDTGHKAANCTIKRNVFATKVRAFTWTLAGDGGGNACDENLYFVETTPALGVVRDVTVTTLESLRAIWSTYSNPTNDAKSGYGPRRFIP